MTIPHLGCSPSSPVWYSDDDFAVLIHPMSGRVLALLWHDGYGKFYPTLYLSILDSLRWGVWPWRVSVWWLCDRRGGRGFFLHPWPYLRLQCVRFKCLSMAEAQEALEMGLAVLARQPCPKIFPVLAFFLTALLAVCLALFFP